MMKLAKITLTGLALLLTFSSFAQTQTQTQPKPIDWSDPVLSPLVQFLNQEKITQESWPTMTYIDMVALPTPYDFLLTQPLMTMGIAKHYERTPKVRSPLYVINNPTQKTYSRAILMIVDNNKARNDALAADKIGEATIAELGIIIMNFAALPQSVIDGVQKTNVPFGALLADSGVITYNTATHYFKIDCNKALNRYLNCSQHPVLYGRTNTLIREDNAQQVAQTVEILTGSELPGMAKTVW